MAFRRLTLAISCFTLVLTGSYSQAVRDNTKYADIIYINGTVLTMDSLNTVCEAVAIKNGRILEAGSTERIRELQDDNTVVNDLEGKTLIPGFIDSHSHFLNVRRWQSVNISPPPVGTVTKIADIVTAIQNYIEEHDIREDELITAWGYDPDQLEEKRHPRKEDLDSVFKDNPLVLVHTSGHLRVINSVALRESGIDRNTPDPVNGVIVREPASGEPTGLLMGSAMRLINAGNKERSELSFEESLGLLKRQQQYYASAGITTAQDGGTNRESLKFLSSADDIGEVYIDVVLLPSFGLIDLVINDPEYKPGRINKHLSVGGVKYYSDGSPQGKTAFFSQPYNTEVPGCDSDCRGIPNVSQEHIDRSVLKAFSNNIQFYVHANGDSAIGMFISAVEKANIELGDISAELRPVVVHSQFVRSDQLDKYARLGIIPSFFSNHAFFWGDVHNVNLGKERAWFLSPLKSSLRKGIIFTNHTDFWVTPIDQLFLLWTSVVRQSRSGEIIGPAERITPMEGLRALTINGAYQYFQEDIKGSLEAGKLADMVILSDNPVTVAPDYIKDIIVLETIKEGKTVYVSECR